MTFSSPRALRLPDEDVDLPDNARWSLAEQTPCGLRCYMRPCQSGAAAGVPGATPYPLADICATDKEQVIVVDDDDDLRELLVELVEALGFKAIGCASAAQLMEQAPQTRSGCILLDIKLPGQDGLAIQDWLKQSDITLPVIFVSGVQDVGTVVHCMKAGAVEFLQKPFNELTLRRAVHQAVGLSRQRFCEEESKRMLRALVATLTPTELFVANRIAQGNLTKRIAADMGRSENTVKIHRHRVFTKLKVHSAASVANIMHYVGLPAT